MNTTPIPPLTETVSLTQTFETPRSTGQLDGHYDEHVITAAATRTDGSLWQVVITGTINHRSTCGAIVRQTPHKETTEVVAVSRMEAIDLRHVIARSVDIDGLHLTPTNETSFSEFGRDCSTSC